MHIMTVAGVFGFSAVALGAFGAHGLEDVLTNGRLEWWKTASHYHLIHSVLLAVLGASADRFTSPSATTWVARAFGLTVVGILLFAGTLYAMALGGPRWLGAITPIGGLALLGGWSALAIAGLRDQSAR